LISTAPSVAASSITPDGAALPLGDLGDHIEQKRLVLVEQVTGRVRRVRGAVALVDRTVRAPAERFENGVRPVMAARDAAHAAPDMRDKGRAARARRADAVHRLHAVAALARRQHHPGMVPQADLARLLGGPAGRVR
jgi:hypothetical protein